MGLGGMEVGVGLGVAAAQALRKSAARKIAAPGLREGPICGGLYLRGSGWARAGSVTRAPHRPGRPGVRLGLRFRRPTHSIVARSEDEYHRPASRLGVEVLRELGFDGLLEVAAVGAGRQLIDPGAGVFKELFGIPDEDESF